MSRPCRICGHDRRSEIEKAILSAEPHDLIALRFGTSVLAILGHRSHISAGAAETPPAPRGPEPLLDQMRILQEKCLGILQAAESSTEVRRVFLATHQVRVHLKRLGDLMERLQKEHGERSAQVPSSTHL